jgi:hypothetical protein
MDRRAHPQEQLMFDILQLGLIMTVAAAILGSALAYAWRDANRDPRHPES